MELLGDYDDAAPAPVASSSSSDLPRAPPRLPQVVAAPPAPRSSPSSSSSSPSSSAAAAQLALQAARASGVLAVNLPADILFQGLGPGQGALSLRGGAQALPLPAGGDSRRTLVGTAHVDALDAATFARQYNSFATYGFAADPGGSGGLVGDVRRAVRYGNGGPGDASAAASISAAAAAAASAEAGCRKRARLRNDDAASSSYLGPWAGFEGEDGARVTALERGELTLKQKLIRVDQGLDPDGKGELEGEALTAARLRLEAQLKREVAAAAAAAGVGTGTGVGAAAKAGAAIVNRRAQAAAQAAAGDEVDEAASAEADAGAGAGAGVRKDKSLPRSIEAAAASAALVAAASAAAEGEDEEGEDAEAGADSVGAGAGGGRFGPGLRASTASSVFHGKALFDYQGRPWCAPPKGLRPDGGDHECFVPKRTVHRWLGHSKGVQACSFFPGTGHLLLTAGLDGAVKVWDVHGGDGGGCGGGAPRGVRRTYSGHTAAVREARFSADGTRIASASYDRCVGVWDTETGLCTQSIAVGSVPFCVAWCPSDAQALLVGTAKRRVLQYDLRSGKVEIEYDHHLGPVNTVTFFDDGKKFVSTGDDKKVLVWELATPVPVKYITDPTLPVINAVALHPSQQFFVGQSMDNTLAVYACGDKVGRVFKKTFKGHITAGYACVPSFSPDGHFLASGDGDGSLWVWDWRSGRVLAKRKVHDSGPTICTAWSPLQPSWVATAGWDGSVTLED